MTGGLPLLMPLVPLPAPTSGNHQSVFIPESSAFLGCTYKEDHAVFVFLWVMLLSMMPSWPIHVVTDFLFLWPNNISLYIYTHTQISLALSIHICSCISVLPYPGYIIFHYIYTHTHISFALSIRICYCISVPPYPGYIIFHYIHTHTHTSFALSIRICYCVSVPPYPGYIIFHYIHTHTHIICFVHSYLLPR